MTQAFNLSQLANNVNSSGLLNAAAGLYNQLPVANGGTGVATVASGAILVGAGTSAMTAVPAATAGNVLTANGTTWASAASAGGPAPVVTIYTSPSPWTKSPTLKAVKVTVVAGGGGGPNYSSSSATRWGSGAGAVGIGYFPAPTIAGPVTVTVGAAGTNGGPTPNQVGGTGGTSSFGSLITATGGVGAVAPGPTNSGGAGGSITPSPAIFGINGMPGGTIRNTGVVAASPAPFSPAIYAGGNSGLGMGTGAAAIDLYTDGPATSVAAIGYGGGGSAIGTLGKSGGPGVIIVEEFY